MIRMRFWPMLVSILGLGALAIGASTVWTQEAPRAEEGTEARADDATVEKGVEVLARGPVHEAYAEPVTTKPRPGPLVRKQPPAAIEEVPPDQKPEGENVQWVAGYWGWEDDRSDFIWVSGFWRTPPPDRRWVPGYWARAEGGWQWTPGFWEVEEQEDVTYLAPPPDPIDSGPNVPAPAADNTWVPGCWVYRETRYVWRPGYWLAYRSGWVWVPAHYVWTPGGCVFVEGYWDYTLRSRGLLFAPVYLDPGLVRANWLYRPRHVVYTDFLFSALFVRAGYGSYYFGDYFDPRYDRLGYVSWFDYRFGGRGYDPLYSYYRWENRNDRRWDRDLRDLYVARRAGEAPRPPQTFAQQTTLIQNINNKTVTVNNIKNVTVLAPMNQVDRTVVKLQPVSPERLATERKHAQQLRQATIVRQKTEVQVAAQGPPRRPNDAPRSAKLEVTKHPAAAAKPSGKAAPSPPPPVKPEVRPAGKPQAKPEPRGPEPKGPAPKPAPKPEPKPKERPKPEPKPQPEPKPKEKPKPEPKPAPKPSDKDKKDKG